MTAHSYLSSRTYYLPLPRRAYIDSSIKAVRKVAMDHMRKHNDTQSMTVYTSHTKKIEIGTVYHSPTDCSQFMWSYRSGGRKVDAAILPDGRLRFYDDSPY